MQRMLIVTCPVSRELEEIAYEVTPVGSIITGCSRFWPRCELTCTRACAARLDHPERELEREQEMPEIELLSEDERDVR